MSDVIQKKMRLKYFYHIDTDKLIHNILEDSSYKNINSTEPDAHVKIFHLIFSHMVSASERYTCFILGEHCLPSHSFFSEIIDDTTIKNTYCLSGISLFNHCILHGFNQLLAHSSLASSPDSKFAKSEHTIKLSNANEVDIMEGFLYSTTPKYSKSESEPIISAQNYTKRYNTLINSPDKFIYKYLSLLCNSEIISTPPSIKKTESTGALFMFCEHSTTIFDNILDSAKHNNINLLKKYIQIVNDSIKWKEKLRYSPDKVLFDNVVEKAYDFHFNSYVFDLFNKELTNPPTSAPSLADLFGKQFTNILTTYATTMPMTYNKSIFLNCALNALAKTDTITPGFPPPPANNAGTYTSYIPENKITYCQKALELLTNYYLTLHHITLPVLEDLWDVLTNSPEFHISVNDYCEFIEKYYNVITYDYTLLAEHRLTSGPVAATYQNIYNYLYDYLKDNEDNYQPSYNFLLGKNNNIPQKELFMDYFSPLLDRTLIFSNRHPSNDQLAQQLCLSPDECQERKSYCLETKDYQLNSLYNLFKFVTLPNNLYFSDAFPTIE